MKKTLILCMFATVLLLGIVFSYTYSTSSTKVSQGFSVTARANWDATTGKFSSIGTYTVNSKPSSIGTVYHIQYLNYNKVNDYKVFQNFQPKYYNVLFDRYTYGEAFGIPVETNGPL